MAQINPAKIIDTAYPLVRAALVHLYQHHGDLTRDPIRASAILAEEMGEATSQALALTRDQGSLLARSNMVHELAQVAAVAMFIIAQHCRPEDFDGDPDHKGDAA